MKKILFRVILLMGVFALFSSCLGDSKSSIEPKNAYAYIKPKAAEQGSICAATSAGVVITSDEIKSLARYSGRVFIMNFKAETTNPIDIIDGYGVFKTNYVDLQNGGFPIDSTDPLSMVQSVKGIEDVPLSFFDVNFFEPTEDYLDDVWVFSYKCKIRESEAKLTDGNLIFRAYLADEMQYLESAEEGEQGDRLPGNKAIVNICVERVNPSLVNPDENLVDYSGRVSISMSRLRNYFEGGNHETENGVATCYIQFQYTGAKSDGKPEDKPVVKGSLSEGNAQYGMLLVTEK